MSMCLFCKVNGEAFVCNKAIFQQNKEKSNICGTMYSQIHLFMMTSETKWFWILSVSCVCVKTCVINNFYSSLVTFQTTFILKRKRRVQLVDAHKELRSRKLKSRHFLYDLVEDTNSRKKEPIKVLLKTSVEGKWLLLMEEFIFSAPRHKALEYMSL